MRFHWPEASAWGVLAAALLMTVVATRAAQTDLAGRDRARFDEHMETMVDAIDRRMNAYADLLIGARAAALANPGFYRQATWDRYIDSLDVGARYPGSRGIGLVWRIGAPGLPTERQVAAQLAADGHPGWRVFPRVGAPGRERFPMVLYRAYDNRTVPTYGYDHLSMGVRREAMARARDSGRPAVTGRFIPSTLRNPGDQRPSFTMYLPVYAGDAVPPDVESRRRQLRGYLLTGFRPDELFRDVFGRLGAAQLGYRIYDGDQPRPEALLLAHDLLPGPEAAAIEGRLLMHVAGRPWLIDAWTPAGMPLGGPPQAPWIVALGGSLIALALFGLLWSLASARRRAMALAAAMTADLRAADRAKDEWLSVISHELRTPLNFITGFASLLEDEVGGTLTPAQAGYVGKINQGADRMLTLVNDLLDVAKIQAGKFELSRGPTAYGPLVEDVVGSLRPLAEAKGQTLSHAIDPEVRALTLSLDGPRVVQVLTNLLSNAVKFTPAGGTIAVRVRRVGDAVRTEVEDTGVGIAAGDVGKLFEPFRQLDMSATRAQGGTGLGLSICKALVESHGGMIGLDSAPGAGSTFWFTLPIG